MEKNRIETLMVDNKVNESPECGLGAVVCTCSGDKLPTNNITALRKRVEIIIVARRTPLSPHLSEGTRA